MECAGTVLFRKIDGKYSSKLTKKQGEFIKILPVLVLAYIFFNGTAQSCANKKFISAYCESSAAFPDLLFQLSDWK